jgi:hypothetical protein
MNTWTEKPLGALGPLEPLHPSQAEVWTGPCGCVIVCSLILACDEMKPDGEWAVGVAQAKGKSR